MCVKEVSPLELLPDVRHKGNSFKATSSFILYFKYFGRLKISDCFMFGQFLSEIKIVRNFLQISYVVRSFGLSYFLTKAVL